MIGFRAKALSFWVCVVRLKDTDQGSGVGFGVGFNVRLMHVGTSG